MYKEHLRSTIWNRGDAYYDGSYYMDRDNGILADKTTSSEQVPSGTEALGISDGSFDCDSDSSIGSGNIGAAVELVVQPHQAPVSSVGGSSSNDDDRKKDKDEDKYVPRRGRRR